jgi:restriction system protein
MTNINTEHAEFINWIAPLLSVLKEKGGSATTTEVRDNIAEQMKLTDDILTRRYKKSGQLAYNNQVYWAKQYLVWEGLVEVSKRGVWALTNVGAEIAPQFTYNEALALFNKWIKIHSGSKKETDIIESSQSKDQIEIDIPDSAEERLSLLEVIKQTSATGFEHLCGRLLREYDFESVEITKRSHDGGIDGTAILKLNPFVNMSVFFQCKKYDGAVPIAHIREFIGVLESEKRGVDKGLFITTGTFPTTAKEIEKNNTKLELIDGDKLVEMFQNVELGVTRRIEYDPELDFFKQYM